MKREKGYMDFRLYTKIIDEVKEWQPYINIYFAGESLLHKQCVDMIDYAEERGCKVILTTNATVLDEELSQQLIHSKLSYIRFSFDGVVKEVYDSIRKGGNHKQTLTNIMYFLKEKRRKPKAIVEILDIKKDKKNVELSVKKFRRIVNAIRIKQPMNWAGSIDIESRKEEVNKVCWFPWHYGVVTWDGKMVACCRDYDKQYILGDVNNESIIEIWYNKKSRTLRDALIIKQVDDIDICRRCNETKE